MIKKHSRKYLISFLISKKKSKTLLILERRFAKILITSEI